MTHAAGRPATTERPLSPLAKPAVRLALLVGIGIVALGLRAAMLHWKSLDFDVFLLRWYETMKHNGGFHALKDSSFADYNVPYLYLMAALTYLPIGPLAGIKAISIAFDLLQAFFVFRIVALRYPRRDAWQPFAAALLVLVMPTVAVNSGWWAQADGIYTSFVVGAVYFVLAHRPWWACSMLGFALAFKLQTVFVFPFLLVVLVTRRVLWRSLLAIPAVYLALDIPAFLLGAEPVKLMTVYTRQADSYPQLTLNAPSLYQFVKAPADPHHLDTVRSTGVLAAGAVVVVLIALAVLSRTGRLALRNGAARPTLTQNQVLLTAVASAITVPFLLPSMHDRYFYIADVLSVLAAFYLPRRLWFAPILVQVASLSSYLPFLRPKTLATMMDYQWSTHVWELVAASMGAAGLAVLVVTALEYRRLPAEPATDAAVPSPRDSQLIAP
ncbi:DUF2029 domain-containing protein [Streptomyces sp. NRRL WC-3742]|uniref:DUF2029 domain-containing protein n=1 Tax=Streptomyces sp. NRRL WC-3742 TaxID=1463934 RepID=UPI0006905216|nr:DUF2029 domain-containing protein [Streptomyces sp. NRRL WC-3742]